ncbi:TPA: PIN-like domain-containing protein [Enterococcus faecalis]
MKSSEELLSFLNCENALIVLDSSAILDIYKHDQAYSHNLLKTYQINLEQIWIPEQVNFEVEKNHRSVKASRKTEIKKLPQNINQAIVKLKQSITSTLKNPQKFNYPSVSTISDELEAKIAELENIVSNYHKQVCQIQEENQPDVIIDFLEQLKELNQVGKGYDIFDKISLYNEGKIRYKLNIPPGFMDAKSKDKKDETGIQKYGDLLIWKEILDKINLAKRPLLFITSDVKRDWWELDNESKIIEKHPLLSEEFVKCTGLDTRQFEMLFTGTFFNLMLGTNDFINQSYDKTIELIVTDYSLNIMNRISSFKTLSDIEDELNEKLELDFEFSNGEFTMYLEETFVSLEVIEITNTQIIEADVSNEEGYLIMRIDLSSICDVNTECAVYGDHKVYYGYDVDISYTMNILIPLKEKELICSENSYPIFNEKNILELDKVEIEYEYNGINQVINTSSPYDIDEEYGELCIECQVEEGKHRTYNYEMICSNCSQKMDACPGCGLFFQKGSIGAFCQTCESKI